MNPFVENAGVIKSSRANHVLLVVILFNGLSIYVAETVLICVE